MKHTIATKFIAILLAALALVSMFGSAIGIALLTSMGQYSMSLGDWYAKTRENQAENMAASLAERYAAQQLSNCPEPMLERDWLFSGTDQELSHTMGVREDGWAYSLWDPTEKTQIGDALQQPSADTYTYTFQRSAEYPVAFEQKPESWVFTYGYGGDIYYIDYQISPEYTVTIQMEADALESYNGLPMGFLKLFFGMRYGFIVVLLVSLLSFAVCAVYLCCAAGKTARDGEVCPGGLNKMALDLYLVLAGTACVLLVMLSVAMVNSWFYAGGVYNLGVLGLAGIVLTVAAVIGIGFFFALAAQLKMPGAFWWHNSVIGWCLDRIFKGIRFAARALMRLLQLLPVIWQYLLIGGAMGLFPLLFAYLALVGRSFWLVPLFLSCLCDAAVVCYGAYAFGTLTRGAQQMAEGNLNTQIDTRYLLGAYKDCASHLNRLADVATIAVQKQLKSERMKTELITNVSHDIKTPLTSIINYVDLLEKPHSPQEQEQYLEVLGRQSQRLKKLIEDLMEMSKATTGNMTVEISCVDAAETVKQALGEFADKLAAAELQPVFRQPTEPVHMLSDGRLTWRVLSNLLSNIVKYALPGTRVYINLLQTENSVMVSLKNISREALNVTADELTERFVRGDASRNTEGSGLGLNIAKSLMELQKGQLQLLVDGDLFKVTLIFPAA